MLAHLYGPLADVGGGDFFHHRRKVLLLHSACFSRLIDHLPATARDWMRHAALAADGKYVKTRLAGEGEAADWDLCAAMETASAELHGRLQAMADLWTWNFDSPSFHDDTKQFYFDERKMQAVIVRDLFGNPFRPVKPHMEMFSRSFCDTAVSLAEEIYREQDFARMPALADAIENAGWRNTDLLSHFRQPQTHYKGCWAIDLLLSEDER
jgi:hypothetical protein